ncbi:MAG: hypothetical protein GWO44_24195, partial [Thermoplasmata archaeon]|nr:hypothetical protein [Thermoplasmata archaeon]NIY06285.1 hypothetical protein [Thermoplasmata archaeon]
MLSKDGTAYQVFRHADEGRVTYYAKNGDEIVGGVTGDAGKVTEGLGISQGLDDTARGIMSQIWDIAREHGDEFILQSGLSPTVSEDALAFAQKYAKKLLGDAADNNPWQGFHVDDLFGPDGGLKRPLHSFAEGVGEVFTRPDMLIPGQVLLGKVNKQAIMESVERAIVQRGCKPSDGARITMYSSLPGRVRQAAVKMVPQEIRKFMTQANVVTRFDLHGPNAVRDIMNQTIKIWGDDIAKSDHWVGRFVQHRLDSAKKVQAMEIKQAALAPRRVTIERLMEINGGGVWDDTL